jgi:hypothetical protein
MIILTDSSPKRSQELGQFYQKQRKKAPKGRSRSLWSLHIRSFWKNHFISPPEVKGKSFGNSFTGRTITMPRYQNFPFGSTGKIAGYVPNP